MESDKSARERFVEAMRDLAERAWSDKGRASVEAACDAFADAECGDCDVWTHNHRECRASLRRAVFGDPEPAPVDEQPEAVRNPNQPPDTGPGQPPSPWPTVVEKPE